MTVELLRCWLCSKVKAEASGKHEGLHCSLEGRFRLVAVVHLRNSNDCCCPEQSLRQDFGEGLLYTSKLPLESDDRQVTALACADLVLSTHSSPRVAWTGPLKPTVQRLAHADARRGNDSTHAIQGGLPLRQGRSDPVGSPAGRSRPWRARPVLSRRRACRGPGCAACQEKDGDGRAESSLRVRLGQQWPPTVPRPRSGPQSGNAALRATPWC